MRTLRTSACFIRDFRAAEGGYILGIEIDCPGAYRERAVLGNKGKVQDRDGDRDQ